MPAAAKHFAVPKPGVPRPALPLEHVNPHLRSIDASKPPAVKFQEIVRDGQATIVGRVKIPTPGGHAFILRRLDTGAISVTTMFRAAFPTANEEAEKAETTWIKLSFDTSGANKSGKARFAGTWVTPDVALYLADSYALDTIIPSLANAVPDPNTTFRRSKGQQPTPTASPAAEPGPAPAKRRREASPASPIPAKAQPPAPAPAPVETPTSPQSSHRGGSPAPRRSARLRSPGATAVPQTQPLVPPTPTKTPRARRAAREEHSTPAGSDETAVDEDSEAAKVAEPNMQDDIQEQKELIAKLKAERAAAKAKAIAEAEAEGEQETEEAPTPSQQEAEDAAVGEKRPREEAPTGYRFNFKEPGQEEVGERATVTNRRVRLLSQMPPERKSLAWGTLAFAIGLGAVTFLPNLQAMF
ncbi:transcription factor [Ganoderma sinense ZZ0214-1]|uniref:Transcription factor n=1 Tax=Ganoderma sinense ZZ0214-1 TaxID=1077348 RepID=A0A2G8SP67_9APHY|nr:transcription factor [Ganoderma sinense ZZ0214-1]